MKFQRFIALFILIIPGALGVYGWTMMRNAVFDALGGESFPILFFLGGLVLFLLGVAFVGGFIFHRDKKRKLVRPKFINDLDD